MAAAERHVHHLRLRAESAAQARRGALRIEDALRCASLPDAGAPLLLVRRLTLGRVDADGATQTVALQIERCVHALAPQWQHGDADDAVAADAVWFGDRAQALACLAQRLAEGWPAAAWYWRRLLPGAAQPARAAPGLRDALLALAAEPGARATLPRLLAALHRPAARERLRGALNESEASAVRRAVGLATTDGNWVDAVAALAPDTRDAPPSPAARRAERSPPPRGLQPIAAEDTALPRGAASPRDLRAAAAVAGGETAATGGAVAMSAPRAAPARTATATLPFDTTLPTAAGGLLFLLPLLARLGFAAWQAELDPDGRHAVAARVLRQALRRLRVAGDDPAWALCAALLGAPADDREADGEAFAADWLTRCRHALRRRVGIGLASLVRRPARLAWTRSHIDLHFALSATDLRVRRHGLDLDPGWLPWLGRVVTFHYGER